ncbi:MAG: Smr/MutS family protein [Thermoanaerobaculia bacterium]
MDEDETFRRLMESAGVAPLDPTDNSPESEERRPADEPRRRSSQRFEPAADEADRLLFEAAMRDLDTAPLDTTPAEDVGGSRPDAAARTPRRIRPRKKDLRVDDRVDLHRCTADEAAKQLQRALSAALRSRSRALLVITGKGHHSPGGVPVLRQRVEEWIRRHGRRHGVGAYSEAPRALGGRGAFVLYLQSRARS